MTIESPSAKIEERPTLAVGMALTALSIGVAMKTAFPGIELIAFFWLSIGLASALFAVAGIWSVRLEARAGRLLMPVLVLGILFEMFVIFHASQEFSDDSFVLGICGVGLLLVIQARNLGTLKVPLITIALVVFAWLLACEMLARFPNPGIDVFVFQRDASHALLRGVNPYDAHQMRYPNIYDPDTPFYGPGVIDKTNHLTYGFPYPPVSLLMVLPAYVGTYEVRFANIIALVLSAALMMFARPGRIGIFAAGLLMLTLRLTYVLELDWTEPLLLFNFSLVMFCACRWKKGLPWVLGLFFATKQYTVLCLPAVWLLIDSPAPWRELLRVYIKAGLVVLATILPFFLWNPHEFIRAVVLWQLVQPFRYDALSYLVQIYPKELHKLPPLWLPFTAIIPAIGLALWRLPRTPAGFAAAVTLINLAFFAFNKQAFCNYYFFVVATACWSVAAYQPPPTVREPIAVVPSH